MMRKHCESVFKAKVESPYMDLEQAAEYLRLASAKTLNTWAKRGFVEYYSVGRRKLFDAAQLDKFVATRLKSNRRIA